MFFGIPEVEADSMDPQQKLLLQCTYRALEDAGIAMESISGSRTGVYIGIALLSYILKHMHRLTMQHVWLILLWLCCCRSYEQGLRDDQKQQFRLHKPLQRHWDSYECGSQQDFLHLQSHWTFVCSRQRLFFFFGGFACSLPGYEAR